MSYLAYRIENAYSGALVIESERAQGVVYVTSRNRNGIVIATNHGSVYLTESQAYAVGCEIRENCALYSGRGAYRRTAHQMNGGSSC